MCSTNVRTIRAKKKIDISPGVSHESDNCFKNTANPFSLYPNIICVCVPYHK